MRKNKIGITMAYLSEAEQLTTLEMWLRKLYESERYDLLQKIMYKVTNFMPDKSNKLTGKNIDTRTIEDWMEKRFIKDNNLLPARIAAECRKYKKWDVRMMPLLVKTAQKVKHRIVRRGKRAK